MSGDFVDGLSNFYVNLFTLEWKKLVLPVLMVLLLSISAFSTLSLQQSPEMDRRMDISVETMTNLSLTFLKTEYFNDSMNRSQKQLSREISDRGSRLQAEAKPKNFRWKVRAVPLQDTGLFPLTPDLQEPKVASRSSFLSAYALIKYRQERFSELDKRLNSSENMSLDEFNSRADEIRSVDWKSEKMKAFLRNYTLDNNSGVIGGVRFDEDARQSVIDENFQSPDFIYYLPALFATFVLYYILNAVLVESGRNLFFRMDDQEVDEKPEESKDSEDEEESKDDSDPDGEGESR